ncbi:MAG: hypothetical protein J7M38_08755, partial [Armatimonadetes bacterium]|nr:hypothetical protein [Armatimonadota bacterium]
AAGGAKAVIPGLEDENITTESLQIAIRKYLLPSLNSAVTRIEAVAENADPSTDPVIIINAGEDAYGIYPADLKVVLSILHSWRAFLYELVAYQLNWGNYDWTVDIVTRDANGDGLLTPDEYAPADPFLWKHPAPNMQLAGQAVRQSITCLIWAIQNRGDESLATAIVDSSPSSAADMIAWLRDLRALLTEAVTVTVTYTTKSVADVPLNLGAIYNDPVEDIKDLFPTLHVVCSLGDCWAEIGDASDFPDLTFHGVFPDPQAIQDIIAAEPDTVTLTYDNIEIPLTSWDGSGIF